MDSNISNERQSEPAQAGSLDAVVSLPRGPWVASCQYGMHFILSQDNEILWRCDWLPMPILKAMVEAANRQANAKLMDAAPEPQHSTGVTD